jgi:hypothetical protein
MVRDKRAALEVLRTLLIALAAAVAAVAVAAVRAALAVAGVPAMRVVLAVIITPLLAAVVRDRRLAAQEVRVLVVAAAVAAALPALVPQPWELAARPPLRTALPILHHGDRRPMVPVAVLAVVAAAEHPA